MYRTRWLAALVFALVPAALVAQEKADRVRFVDRAKSGETTRTGTVTAEDPMKLTLVTGNTRQRQDIPAADLVDVLYDGEPAEMDAARKAERARNYDQAAASYQAALRKVVPAQKFLHAQVQFKNAEMLGQVADNGDGPSRQAALVALRQFRADHPDARQILPALDLFGRLLLQDGQPVQEVVDGLTSLKARFPRERELGGRCDVLASQFLLQEAEALLANKPDEARRRFGSAQMMLEAVLPNADSAAALDLKLGLAASKAGQGQVPAALAELDGLLKSVGDTPRARAAVHLTRGDCLRLAGRAKEALWDYLWVDAVYYQDRDQHARALYQLSVVFATLGEDARARECRDRLLSDTRLRDTRYQKLAAR